MSLDDEEAQVPERKQRRIPWPDDLPLFPKGDGTVRGTWKDMPAGTKIGLLQVLKSYGGVVKTAPFKLDPYTATMDAISKRWGNGTYRLQLYSTADSPGGIEKIATRTIEITDAADNLVFPGEPWDELAESEARKARELARKKRKEEKRRAKEEPKEEEEEEEEEPEEEEEEEEEEEPEEEEEEEEDLRVARRRVRRDLPRERPTRFMPGEDFRHFEPTPREPKKEDGSTIKELAAIVSPLIVQFLESRSAREDRVAREAEERRREERAEALRREERAEERRREERAEERRAEERRREEQRAEERRREEERRRDDERRAEERAEALRREERAEERRRNELAEERRAREEAMKALLEEGKQQQQKYVDAVAELHRSDPGENKVSAQLAAVIKELQTQRGKSDGSDLAQVASALAQFRKVKDQIDAVTGGVAGEGAQQEKGFDIMKMLGPVLQSVAPQILNSIGPKLLPQLMELISSAGPIPGMPTHGEFPRQHEQPSQPVDGGQYVSQAVEAEYPPQ